MIETHTMTEEQQITLESLFDAFGLDVTEQNILQMSVFMEAMNIYQDREAQHGQLWQRFGWLDSIHHMRHKMERLWRRVWNEQIPEFEVVDYDSAYDLLNYTAFLIRNARAGNKSG